MEAEFPPGCRAALEELERARGELAAANLDMAQARSAAERQQAAAEISAAQQSVDRAQAALNQCLGFPDPVTNSFSDIGQELVLSSDTRIGLTTGALAGPVPLAFSGRDHQSVLPATPGDVGWVPFPLFTFTMQRRFPDIFTSFIPVTFSLTPYTISVTPFGGFRVEAGSYDRQTGQLNLSCAGWIGWLPSGAPPSWLYGLDFSRSSYRGLFTTGSVPKTVPLIGSRLTGSPLDRSTGLLTLVSAGMLTGGFGSGMRVEFTFFGALVGPLPVGPR